MSEKKEERRAEDQDAAIETAFVEGKLPDHDRRAEEEVAPEPSAEPIEPIAEVVPEVVTSEPEPEPIAEIPEVVPEIPVVPEVIEAEQKPAPVVSEAFPSNIRTSST